MNQPASALRHIWLRQVPLVLLFITLFFTLLPSRKLGFVSDDYGHLVEAATLPITSSTDGLHRPLRNILFRIAYAAFGLNPAPYHVGMILLHLALVVAVYRFAILLSAGNYGAFVSATLFAFFPRNHQSLFWIAAAQDTVVALCTIVSCGFLVRYRRDGRRAHYVLALVSYSIALGFKETAITIFPLLVLVDLTFGRVNSALWDRRRWIIYAPFVIVTGLYLLWVFGQKLFGWTGEAQNYYGFQSVSQTVKLAIKFVFNMLVPFFGPAEPRDLLRSPMLALLVALAMLTFAIVCLVLVRRRELLLTVGWMCAAMAPTAVFGFYTDRYLLMPFIGMALLVGFLAQASIVRFGNKGVVIQLVVVGLVCLYVVVAVPCLLRYQVLWSEASQEIKTIIEQTRRLHPSVPNGSVFYFINLTHSKENGQVYVLNTSLNGALRAGGYDKSVTTQRTFSSDDPREHQLIARLLSWSLDVPGAVAPGVYVLVYQNKLIDVTGDCGNQTVQASRSTEPELWK